MAKYVKVSARLDECPDCLNRTFLFNIEGTLQDLCDAISYLIGATFEHPYEIQDPYFHYWTEEMLAGNDDDFLHLLNLQEYRLDQIDLYSNRTLYYCYDFGENYLFKLHIGTRLFEKEGDLIAIPVKGYGVSIFEDNKDGLLDYYQYRKLPKEEYPWNYKMTRNSNGFFRELTVKEMTKSLADLGSIDPLFVDEEDIDLSFYSSKKTKEDSVK